MREEPCHPIRPALLLAAAVSVFALVPCDALARAGGGGGGGGGGIVAIILLPFFLIYSAIVSGIARKKSREAKTLLRKLAKRDSDWDQDFIKRQIERVYFKVQEAWMERNQDLARHCMSDRLYEKHKLQTDQMIRQRRKNVLERINLAEAQIVEAADYKDDAKDELWAIIKGSMIDYIIDEDTGKVVSGKDNEPEHFTELWKFVRGPSSWVLDEIDQRVGIGDLRGMLSFSDEMGAATDA